MFRLLVLGLLVVSPIGCKKDRPATLEGKDVGELSQALRDGKPEEKAAAALELSKRGAESRSAVPALIESLQSDDPAVRQNAALALGKIGPHATEAVEPLIKSLADPDWGVRRNAVMALGEIGDPKARTAVEGMARDPDSLVRKAAEQSAKRLRPQ